MSKLNITIIQTNLYWEDKAKNLSMLKEKIFSIDEKTEVIVLPEMFNTGFSMRPQNYAETMDGETIGWMQNIAQTKKVIITGSLMIFENNKYFNRLIWMQPNGIVGYYDKRHLFAFANEDQHYTAGSKRLITSVNGFKICLLICYDLRFPVWSRQQIKSQRTDRQVTTPEYDMLIYVANWPERRNLAWKTLLQARAIENQCYVIGVNRIGNDGNEIYHSGDSMIVDPMGDIIYSKNHEEDIFTHLFEKSNLKDIRNKFPFWKDGDTFSIS